MTYTKEQVTITLEGQEVTDFWDIIMFALDYNNIAKKSKPSTYTPLSESQTKLAEKLEEVSRPSFMDN